MLPLDVQEALIAIRGKGPLSACDAGLIFTYREEEPFRSYLAKAERWLKHARRVGDYFKSVQLEGASNTNESSHALANPAGWGGTTAILSMMMLLSARGRRSPGEVFIEAGVFKGGAASCLSPVCHEAGIRYIAADTFEGLPWDGNDGVYYKGQFCGRMEEVKKNLVNNDAYDGVEFAVGLFKDTLPTLRSPVAGIFLDTDLYESTHSALESVMEFLRPDSIIFLDGVVPNEFRNDVFTPQLPESKGAYDALNSAGLKYVVKHTYLGSMAYVQISGDEPCSVDLTYRPEFFFPFHNLLLISTYGPEFFNPFKKSLQNDNKSLLPYLADGALFYLLLRSIRPKF